MFQDEVIVACALVRCPARSSSSVSGGSAVNVPVRVKRHEAPFNRRRGTEPNSSPRKLPTSIGFHYASGSRYHCTVSIRPWVKIGMISSRVSTESFGFDGVSHYISPAREAQFRTFGCLVVRLAKSTCGPRPKFVWLRREPLYACLDAAAYVPDDGDREPGTGVLRPVRGVRGPRDTGNVPHRGARRTRA